MSRHLRSKQTVCEHLAYCSMSDKQFVNVLSEGKYHSMSNKQLVNIEDDKLSMEKAKRDRSGKRTLSIVKLFCNPLFSGNTKYQIQNTNYEFTNFSLGIRITKNKLQMTNCQTSA